MSIPGYETKCLLTDNFDTDLENWVFRGDGSALFTGTGRLNLTGNSKKNGVVLWLKEKIHHDFLLEYEINVNDSSGLCAVILCAQSPDNTDILNSSPPPSGNLMSYTKNTNSYLVDFHNMSRSTGIHGASKVRKNPGYMLLSSVDRDPCSESRPYYIDIAKIGNRIQLYVDGVRIHDIRDKGGFGPAYLNGYIGFWVHGKTNQYNAEIDNVRLFRLIPE